jgi:S-formylglutathione hydrolase
MGALGLIFDMRGFGDTPSFSAQKGNFLGPAAKEGIAILFTDTSPRGAGIEGEDDDWDFGTGMLTIGDTFTTHLRSSLQGPASI